MCRCFCLVCYSLTWCSEKDPPAQVAPFQTALASTVQADQLTHLGVAERVPDGVLKPLQSLRNPLDAPAEEGRPATATERQSAASHLAAAVQRAVSGPHQQACRELQQLLQHQDGVATALRRIQAAFASAPVVQGNVPNAQQLAQLQAGSVALPESDFVGAAQVGLVCRHATLQALPPQA